MKIMNCPLNGPRNASEFICAGEVSISPDPNTSSDAEWADYVFLRENKAGVVREWWMHVPTSYWFIAERDTRTNEIKRTYPSSEIFTQRVEYKRSEQKGEPQ